MPNKNYQRGRRKEYKICDELKKEGFDIVQRTAGSHSPIDIIAINSTTRVIKLIQSKRTIKEEMSFTDNKLKEKIEREFNYLNNIFRIKFEAL